MEVPASQEGRGERTRPIGVFLVCSGLGWVHRGLESFTRECFEALADVDGLEVRLFKGGERSHGREVRLWSIRRDGWLVRTLRKLTGRGGYGIEQATFAVGLLPYLRRFDPEVVFFSDPAIGNFLWRWRRLTGARFKLLFSNGAPLVPPNLPRCDFIQQLIPRYLEGATRAGVPGDRQELLPYGIRLPARLEPLFPASREALRRELGLPATVPLVLSVAAINRYHKRIDYLVRELAQLPPPRPFLLMLGQQEVESPAILQLAAEQLGAGNFAVRTVAAEAVADYYRVADLFVLCSLHEGFGRVLVEATGAGLPCLVHDYEVTRFVLGDEGFFADLTVPGNLRRLLADVLATGDDPAARQRRSEAIRGRFGWEVLRPRYADMLVRCAGLSPLGQMF